MTSHIFKVCSTNEWKAAQQDQIFVGSTSDAVDGFIHFSTAGQLSETLRRHFKNKMNLVALRVSATAMETLDLRWESSRGGELFPHLYGELPTAAVDAIFFLENDSDGLPCLPDGALND